MQKCYDQLTFGDFLSVFLLTSTGLSYLTSEEFGGIIVWILNDNIHSKSACFAVNLWTVRRKWLQNLSLPFVTLEMNRVQLEELGSNCSQSDHRHPKLSVKGTPTKI